MLWGNPSGAATVVVIGDSLSDAYSIPRESGWVALLAGRVDGKHEVINASISGETTAGALTRMDAVLASYEPDLALIVLGATMACEACRRGRPNPIWRR